MPETGYEHKPIEPTNPPGEKQAVDRQRTGTAIKRHPVRTGIAALAGAAAGLFGMNALAERQVSPPPTATTEPFSHMQTEADSPAGHNSAPASSEGTVQAKPAKIAEPNEPREIQLCGCGKPLGHTDGHNASSSEPEK